MKVLLLGHSNGGGGAGRAAGRLLDALSTAGVDAQMHVDFRDSDDPRVFRNRSPLADVIRRLRITVDEVPAVLAGHPTPSLFSPGLSSAISARRIDAMAADVVNVHWTNFGYLSVRQLGRISTPMVWTLHDMWALTGGRNYDDDGPDARWRNGFRTPEASASRWDVEAWVWRRKQRYWRSPRALVTPSRWLADLARASDVVRDWSVNVVPNALDTDAFSPRPVDAARARLGLPLDRRYLLVALGGSVDDPRKGFDLLRAALAHLDAPADVELLVVGRASAPDDWLHGLPRAHWLGFLDDDQLVDAYNAADIAVVPSRQDNLPQTGTEPQACGTPVVAFRVGGLPDVVADGDTGLLADPEDPRALAAQLDRLLSQDSLRQSFSEAARQRAVRLWSPSVVAAAHLALFDEVRSRQAPRT